jgi:methionyl-tRNA formyltransferase
LRLVFMGTPDFAVPSLLALVAAGHQLIAVVTQPDKPKGRRQELVSPPVKNRGLALGLPVYQPAKVTEPDFLGLISGLEPELIVTTAFGQILPSKLLNIPAFGAINLHASLLPMYRGASPIHRALMNGDAVTGVTTMYITEQVDSGDIILQAAWPVKAEEDTGQVHDALAVLGANLLLDTIELIALGHAPRRVQEQERVSYAAKLKRIDEIICWDKPAQMIVNQIRGLNPWPGAFTTWNGREIKICRAKLYNCSVEKSYFAGNPGMVAQILRGQGFVVTAGDGRGVLVLEVQPQAKRLMSAAEFINGYPLALGSQLGGVDNSS